MEPSQPGVWQSLSAPGDVPRIERRVMLYGRYCRIYRQALELALAHRQPGQAILALGHCHMAGGEVSAESERRIVIGGAEALSATIFDPAIAYAALGHLHRAQRVGNRNICVIAVATTFVVCGDRLYPSDFAG